MSQTNAELEARIAKLELLVALLNNKVKAMLAPKPANPTTTQKGTK